MGHCSSHKGEGISKDITEYLQAILSEKCLTHVLSWVHLFFANIAWNTTWLKKHFLQNLRSFWLVHAIHFKKIVISSRPYRNYVAIFSYLQLSSLTYSKMIMKMLFLWISNPILSFVLFSLSFFRALCPTRWTVRGEALASVLNNHDELMELWDWSLEILKDTEMKSRITGVKSIMAKFSFYFGCCLTSMQRKRQ